MLVSYQGKDFLYERQYGRSLITAPNGICYIIHKTYGEISASVCKDIAETYLEVAAKHYASEMLRDIKNTEWCDDAPVSKQEFQNRITLQEIEFQSNGNIILYCNDGGLFSGHTVLIKCDAECTPYQIDIVG